MKALHSIAIAALLGFSSVASAELYEFDGTVSDFTNFSYNFTIDASGGTVNSILTGGTWDGKTITGLSTIANSFTSENEYEFSFNISPAYDPSGINTILLVAENFDDEPVSFIYNGLAVSESTELLLNGGFITNQTVTAVPEPETYAMFLAGLGLLGFARRNKQA